MRKSLSDIQKVVIKIGSSSLTHESGRIDLWKMEKLVRQVANIRHSGKHVILVSSGAIAAGMGKLHFKRRPESIPEKQAAAAVGQTTLMHMYEKLFAEYGLAVAQVLLTKEDLYEPSRIEHAKNALDVMLDLGIIPIINENDAVAVEEIKVGDNDTLSAEVCRHSEFELLIILSDIDGVYNKNPRDYSDAIMLTSIDNLEALDAIEASDASTEVGTGGMITKLNAARILNPCHIPLLIVNSQSENILNRCLNGENLGTLFDWREHHEC